MCHAFVHSSLFFVFFMQRKGCKMSCFYAWGNFLFFFFLFYLLWHEHRITCLCNEQIPDIHLLYVNNAHFVHNFRLEHDGSVFNFLSHQKRVSCVTPLGRALPLWLACDSSWPENNLLWLAVGNVLNNADRSRSTASSLSNTHTYSHIFQNVYRL